jgi:predicted nucleic acid-binding protein
VPNVVLDASVLLALVLEEPQTETISQLLDQWAVDGTVLHAPDLAHYEIASALTKNRVRGRLTANDVTEALSLLETLGVVYHPSPATQRIVEIAVDLQRHSAYDAAYLALAEQLSCELWTLDGPLTRNAGETYRVRLI